MQFKKLYLNNIISQTSLFQDRRKQKYCVGCEEVDAVPNNEQPTVQPPTTVVRDVPAGMSREDLYAMLSQQASAREEADVRRTPSPPPRLVEAARTSAPNLRKQNFRFHSFMLSKVKV